MLVPKVDCGEPASATADGFLARAVSSADSRVAGFAASKWISEYDQPIASAASCTPVAMRSVAARPFETNMIDLPDGALLGSGVVCVIDVGVVRALVTAALASAIAAESAEPFDAEPALVAGLELLVEPELLEQAARAIRIAVAVENAAARLLKRRLETGSILKIPSPETRLAVGSP